MQQRGSLTDGRSARSAFARLLWMSGAIALLLESLMSLAHAAPVLQRVQLGDGYPFALYANHPLSDDLRTIEQIIFVVHGVQRDGDKYFEAAEQLSGQVNADPARVLIIAPNFFNLTDLRKRNDLAGLPLWDKTDWMEGAAAVAGPPVSSYAAFDDLLALLTQPAKLPQLRRIVIAGHSGGAQFVDRYAALNRSDGRIRSRSIELTYVIANPSSYLYFTAVRPAAGGFLPYSLDVCPQYNHYRYGMEGIVPYAQGASGPDVFESFRTRAVTYLWGTLDTDPNHPVLDKSCGAEAEGPSRYVRGHSYWRYLRTLADAEGLTDQKAFDVIGVGHDQARMFGSTCGAALLFGPIASAPLADRPGADTAAGAAACRAVDRPQ